MNSNIDTKCLHEGWKPVQGDPRQLPIYQSTTFKYDTSEYMGKLFDLEATGYFYTRLQNPTNDFVAEKICAMEGGVAAMLTSSGQAANFYALFKENKLVGYFDRLYYIEGETLDSYLKRNHIVDTFKYPAITFGFLDDNGYHEEDYVWSRSGSRKRVNKRKRKNRIEFRRKLDEYLESIPDESVIIGVDCHV